MSQALIDRINRTHRQEYENLYNVERKRKHNIAFPNAAKQIAFDEFEDILSHCPYRMFDKDASPVGRAMATFKRCKGLYLKILETVSEDKPYLLWCDIHNFKEHYASVVYKLWTKGYLHLESLSLTKLHKLRYFPLKEEWEEEEEEWK